MHTSYMRYCFCISVLLLSFCSCSRRSDVILTAEQTRQIAAAIAAQLEGPTALLRDSKTAESTPVLHFDQYTNMTGYVVPEATSYKKVVEKLAESHGPGSVYSLGMWKSGTGATIPMQALLNQRTYERQATDYENTFRQITTSSDCHLLVTDGVFWKSGSEQYVVGASIIAKCVTDWLRAGGSFRLTVLESQYDFPYKSAKAFARLDRANTFKSYVEYKVPNRPFTVWTFNAQGKRESALDSLLRLSPSPDGKPRLDLRIGEPLVTIIPSMPPADETLGKLQTIELAGFRPIFLATVLSAGAGQSVSLPFDCTISPELLPSKLKSGEYQSWLDRELTVDMQSWGVDTGGDKIKPETAPVRIESAHFEPSPGSGLKNAQLRVRLQRPQSTSAIICSVVTIRSRFSSVLENSELLSTDNDSVPEQADKLFNFKNLVSAIASDNNIVGRVLLITEWYQ